MLLGVVLSFLHLLRWAWGKLPEWRGFLGSYWGFLEVRWRQKGKSSPRGCSTGVKAAWCWQQLLVVPEPGGLKNGEGGHKKAFNSEKWKQGAVGGCSKL